MSKEKAIRDKQPIIEAKVEEILNTNQVKIGIPEKMDAIQGAALGSVVFGKTGMVLGALTGGEIRWISTKLLLSDTGMTIKKNGQSISFEEIVNLEVNKPSNFSKHIFSITSKYGNNMVFNSEDGDALEIILKEIISETKAD